MTIATTFSVAWLPFQLNLLVVAYGNRTHALLILDSVLTLAFVNSCVNPIIYALMWRPFRISLIQVRISLSADPPLINRFTRCCIHPPVTSELVIPEWMTIM